MMLGFYVFSGLTWVYAGASALMAYNKGRLTLLALFAIFLSVFMLSMQVDWVIYDRACGSDLIDAIWEVWIGGTGILVARMFRRVYENF